MAISYFCDHCGAENAPGETACCACQQPLKQQADLLDANTLLNERYEVLSEIGAGGFGAVYKARDTQKSNQLVAVKQVNLKGLSSQEIIEATDAFNREAEILSTLSHPLLPRIFDRFSDPEHWYLVMTFIDGSTLDEYLQQHMVSSLPASAGLPLSDTLAIALQLCDALHYLHSQQPPVIFRDLKPGNIMRTRGGRLYLIDFGIARRFKPGQAKDTIPFGSPGFAAPEQYGRAQTTPQADIYSLGALLSCLISGDDPSEHPFEFPPLRHNGIAGMHELDVLIRRMVALDATKRPADILDVQTELQHIQQIYNRANSQAHIWTPPPGQAPLPEGSGQQHIFLNPTSTQPKHKTTRRTVLTVGLIAGGVALFGGVAAALGNQIQPQPVSQTYQNMPNSTDQPTVGQNNNTSSLTEQNKNSASTLPSSPGASWSPDLSHAAILNPSNHQLELHSIQYNQVLQTIQLPSSLQNLTVQWSYDNTKILLIPDTGVIQCLDVENKKQLFTLPLDASQVIPTATAIWSPDGNCLALGYSDVNNNNSVFSLWSGINGQQLFRKEISNPDYEALNTLAWSPDSRYIAFSDDDANTFTNGSVEIWDAKRFQRTNTFDIASTDNLNGIASIAWSPDGNRLAILIGSNILLYHKQDNTSFQTISLNDSALNSTLAWSPDGQRLAFLPNENLAIYDIVTGQQASENTSSTLINLTWSADSKKITAVDAYNALSYWSVG